MDLKQLDNQKLIKLYSNSIKELKRREIIRTKNITGELGEYIAVDFYNKTAGLQNLQFAPPSTENIDAISRKGKGIQSK